MPIIVAARPPYMEMNPTTEDVRTRVRFRYISVHSGEVELCTEMYRHVPTCTESKTTTEGRAMYRWRGSVHSTSRELCTDMYRRKNSVDTETILGGKGLERNTR